MVIPESQPGHIRDAAPVEKQRVAVSSSPRARANVSTLGMCGDGLTDQSRGAWSFLVSCDRCCRDAWRELEGGSLAGLWSLVHGLPNHVVVGRHVLTRQSILASLRLTPSAGILTASHQYTTRLQTRKSQNYISRQGAQESTPFPYPGVTQHHHTTPQPLQKTTIYRGAAK